jgi:peptidoglycan hydrolase-like protein with peptidoglycan-binding domain
VSGVRFRVVVASCVVLAALIAAAVAVAIGGSRSGARTVRARATAAVAPPTRLTRLPHAVVADGAAPIVVRLSGPVAADSPRPTLSPKVAGSWLTSGPLETFTPASTLAACATYQLTVWAQTHGAGLAPLGQRRLVRFTVACPPIRAAQEALARLRYLPYRFHTAAGTQTGPESRATAARRAFKPPPGHFVRVISGAPPLTAGRLDPVTTGALMVFQTDHGLTASGTPDAPTWAALLGAETAGRADQTPYTFVTVSQSLPQTLEVHRGNRVALTSPTNTGVPGATTADGIFPIFERLTSTTMSGTNPDGSHYSDPGVPWVNYFNGGDAVHGFDRGSYGSPQSDGCVELPPATAATVYGMLALGDIVEVTG